MMRLHCALSASFPPFSFRVMSFIEKSVARLDQQDRLEALALELGKSHYHYSAPPKYYSVRRPWIIHWCVHSQVLMMPLCLKGNSHVLFLAIKLLPFIALSMKWRRQQTKWTHTLTLCKRQQWSETAAQSASHDFSFFFFLVCRSGIHQCRAAHPEGEVDGRAGGGLEGEEHHCVPLMRAARGIHCGWTSHGIGSMCVTSHICVLDGRLMCTSPEPYMRLVRKMERGSATTRHVTCVVNTERQRVRLMLHIIYTYHKKSG